MTWQVESLLDVAPTVEEIEILRGYDGDAAALGYAR